METGEVRRAVLVLARLARTLERTKTALSLSQYRMLAMIAEREAGRTARSSSLAIELSLTKPTVSVAIEGLQAQGFIARKRDPNDGRAVRVELTDAGRSALAASEAALIERIAPMIGGVSDPDRLLILLGEVEGLLNEAHERRVEAKQQMREAR
jgi:DNA-binding MarR family transcriptional regulator